MQLHRVLGCQDHEGIGQPKGVARNRHLALLHRLEQRRLHLGGRPVDLVGEHDVGEDRPLVDPELARARIQDRRPGDVAREQIGRELDAAEAGVDGVGQRAHHERLGEPGQALEQHMASREQCDQQGLDGCILAHHAFPHGSRDPARQPETGFPGAGFPRQHPRCVAGHQARCIVRPPTTVRTMPIS